MELTDIEHSWVKKFQNVMSAKPDSLQLILDANSCVSDLEIFSEIGTSFTKSDKNWIRRLKMVLKSFPNTPGFWLLSNIDGWNVGKGQPAFYSGTTVGVGGATGSLSDDFASYYHLQVEIDYRELDEAERDECETTAIKSNRGDLRILNLKQ